MILRFSGGFFFVYGEFSLYLYRDHFIFRVSENQFICRQLHRFRLLWIAIEIVSDDRQAMMCEMISDLMGAAG